MRFAPKTIYPSPHPVPSLWKVLDKTGYSWICGGSYAVRQHTHDPRYNPKDIDIFVKCRDEADFKEFIKEFNKEIETESINFENHTDGSKIYMSQSEWLDQEYRFNNVAGVVNYKAIGTSHYNGPMPADVRQIISEFGEQMFDAIDGFHRGNIYSERKFDQSQVRIINIQIIGLTSEDNPDATIVERFQSITDNVSNCCFQVDTVTGNMIFHISKRTQEILDDIRCVKREDIGHGSHDIRFDKYMIKYGYLKLNSLYDKLRIPRK